MLGDANNYVVKFVRKVLTNSDIYVIIATLVKTNVTEVNILSVVVVGGNDRMATRYKEICRSFNCKAKIFTQMPADFENKLGTPDLMVVFTNTCSHKMALSVSRKSEKNDIPVARIHNASANALKSVLEQYCSA